MAEQAICTLKVENGKAKFVGKNADSCKELHKKGGMKLEE